MLHKQGDKAERKGVTLERQVRAFHSIFKKTKRGRWVVDGPRQTWIRNLRLGDEEPRGWPRSKRKWSDARDTWVAYQRVAEAFLAGETLDPIPRADDYGGDCDDARGACDPPKACQQRVYTSFKTRQAWWSSKACVAGRRIRVIPAGQAAGVPAHAVANRVSARVE
jgi:hypothetical protein